MAVEEGTASNHVDLLERLRRFVCGHATYDTPLLTGAGNGTMTIDDTYPSGVTETWTVTCTDATTPGAEVWSVTGSVSGAQTDATTGVAYDDEPIQFTITVGATNFAVSDQFTFSTSEGVMTTAGQAWEELRYIALVDQDLLQLKGKGLSGTDEIFVNVAWFSIETSDVYYWLMEGATGYDASFDWGDQPGNSPRVRMHLWNQPIPYWFIANGRRIIVVAKVSTTYHAMYAGWYLPYFSPTEFSYPFYIGGNTVTASNRWSTTSANDGNFWNPGNDTAYLRNADGNWVEVTNHYLQSGNWSWRTDSTFTGMWPWLRNGSSKPEPYDIRNNRDGSYSLLPSVIVSRANGEHLYGQLDGVYWVSGFANASENEITIGGDTYKVFQDINRTGRNDYAAIKWE